jgi:AraC-like DNA-binding protein/translation initiation factor IF-1
MKFLLSARQSFAVSDPAKQPPHYFPYRIRAATSYYYRNGFGDFFVQIIAGRGFRIQFNIFDILKKKCLYPYTSRPVITLHFMLKGDVHCFLNGFGEAWLKEGRYHLFYIPGKVRNKVWFTKGDYVSFHIDLSPRFLKKLAIKYPELKEVTEKALRHSSEGIQQHPAQITREIIHLIEEIRNCPEKEEPDKSWYLEIRIRELMRLYLLDMPDKTILHPTAVKRLEEIKEYILVHLDRPHTTTELARLWKLNESTLRRQFTSYFGKPLRAFLLSARMEAAMEQLLHTDIPIGNIADTAGYTDFSNFSRAFKKYFQHPPRFFRK